MEFTLLIIAMLICLFTVLANLFILWIVIKLYTEVFKQQKIDYNFRRAREK